MPDSWNPEVYRARALQWLEKAENLPEGDERKTCLIIAEGYSTLATLIEKDLAADFTERSPEAEGNAYHTGHTRMA